MDAPKTAKCPLCEENVLKLHPESHILPRWMEYHDEGQRGLVHMDLRKRREAIRQSGLWASIVCNACEVGFGKYDQYASQLFSRECRKSGPMDRAVRLQPRFNRTGILNGIEWSGVNSERLHKFAVCTALRGHLARLSRDREPLLPDDLFRSLRAEYLASSANTAHFPLLAILLEDPDGIETYCLTPMTVDKAGVLDRIVFQGAGVQFHLWLHSDGLDPVFGAGVLADDGRMITPKMEFRKTAVYKLSEPHLIATAAAADYARGVTAERRKGKPKKKRRKK